MEELVRIERWRRTLDRAGYRVVEEHEHREAAQAEPPPIRAHG